MKRRTLLGLQAVISMICLCFALCVAPTISTEAPTDRVEAHSEISVTVNEAAALAEETETTAVAHAYTEDELFERFSVMLNLNHCYDEAFSSDASIAAVSAFVLSDYAVDFPGVGLCVNTCLIEGFAESFYGRTLDPEVFESDSAPENYYIIPAVELGSEVHRVFSVTQSGDTFEVISTVTSYYGGDDTVSRLSHSVFVRNDASEFGFNLISSELL
ncbi:MAG: hypothetical protein IJA41_11050 [Clostridia bacterium]|nr:hypothetical protein [Clostridia bacterium]